MPAFDNEPTVARAIESLRRQTVASQSVFVVDDGSTDRSVAIAEAAGARVVPMGSNRGRGTVRATAVEEAAGDLLLSVDATAALAPAFAERVLPWFEDPRIAAVYGRITQGPATCAADRWRGRHLYREGEIHEPGLASSLITWGVMLRRSAVLEVGNFDRSLRHSEDVELGQRLIARGWKIAYEPRALVETLVSNSWSQVMERYWRWGAGIRPEFRFRQYAKMTWYSLKVLVARDLRARDLPCAAVSAILPHYCAYRGLRER